MPFLENIIFKFFIFVLDSLFIIEIDFAEFGKISKCILNSFFSDDIEIKSTSLQLAFNIGKIVENISSETFLFTTNESWKIFKSNFFIFF